MSTTLSERVKARNEINQTVNVLAPILIESFKPLVGKKIHNSTGGLTVPAKAIISAVGMDKYTKHSWFNCDYSFLCHVRVNLMVSEETIWIGKMDGNILEKVHDFSPLRADFTVEEIVQARKNVEEYKWTLAREQDRLFYFGEYDL